MQRVVTGHAIIVSPIHCGEASSSGCRCPGSEGSCTGCHSGGASQQGCRRPAEVARSPSGGPCDRRQASHGRLRSVCLRPPATESPARCRQTHTTGSVRDWKTLGLLETKGKSLLRVPSLGRVRTLPLLNIRTGIQSSTVESNGCGARGGGQPEVRDSEYCEDCEKALRVLAGRPKFVGFPAGNLSGNMSGFSGYPTRS